MLVNWRISLSESHEYVKGKCRFLYSAKGKNQKRNIHVLVFCVLFCFFFSEWPLVLDHFLTLHAISKFLIKNMYLY